MALRPGTKSEPETMAAIVSRMWCLVSSNGSSGKARPAASAIYVLSVSITELTWSEANAAGSDRAQAASIHPLRRNQSRRVRLTPWPRLLCSNLGFRACILLLSARFHQSKHLDYEAFLKRR